MKSKYSHSPAPQVWETPGSLRSRLLCLDGALGVVVNAEKRVVDPWIVSGEVGGQLERIAQQMGLGAGDGVVKQLGSVLELEPVKPDFTREAGSFRRQGSLYGVPAQEE